MNGEGLRKEKWGVILCTLSLHTPDIFADACSLSARSRLILQQALSWRCPGDAVPGYRVYKDWCLQMWRQINSQPIKSYLMWFSVHHRAKSRVEWAGSICPRITLLDLALYSHGSECGCIFYSKHWGCSLHRGFPHTSHCHSRISQAMCLIC